MHTFFGITLFVAKFCFILKLIYQMKELASLMITFFTRGNCPRMQQNWATKRINYEYVYLITSEVIILLT